MAEYTKSSSDMCQFFTLISVSFLMWYLLDKEGI